MPGTEYLKNTESLIELLDVSLGTDSAAEDHVAFCIGIANIKEILRSPDLTRLPNMPDGIYGIFSLRNTIIPVMDLSEIVAGKKEDYPGKLLIISEFKDMKFGFTIQSAGEIFRTGTGKIKLPGDDSSTGINLNSVYGKLHYGDKNYFIIDIENIIVNTNFKKSLAYDNSKFSLPENFSAFITGRSVLSNIIRAKLKRAGANVKKYFSMNDLITADPENSVPGIVISCMDNIDPEEINAIEQFRDKDVFSKIPLILISQTGFENITEKSVKIDSAYVISEVRIGNIIEIIRKLIS